MAMRRVRREEDLGMKNFTLTFLFLCVAWVACAQDATPTPSADRECLPFVVGITRCGDLCSNGRRFRLRGCPEVEVLIMDQREPTPTPVPSPTRTPARTSTPGPQPKCPLACPPGKFCSQTACDAFGECACR